MTRVIMHGCNGRMGQMITNIVNEDNDIEIVAGVDVSDHVNNTYPVFKTIFECDIKADVIIDFANAKAVDDLLKYSVDNNIPVVLCTTGLSEEQLENMKKASEKVAILKSANMSLGINTLIRLLKEATAVFAKAGFDIEIVEKHHNQKLDAPSGTALALADSINEELNGEYIRKLKNIEGGSICGVTMNGSVFTISGRQLTGYYDSSDLGIDDVHALLPELVPRRLGLFPLVG